MLLFDDVWKKWPQEKYRNSIFSTFYPKFYSS
jgi:hypothetical protein